MIIILLDLKRYHWCFSGKIFRRKSQSFAKNLLILSAGFLITVCVSEVFPEVYEADGP